MGKRKRTPLEAPASGRLKEKLRVQQARAESTFNGWLGRFSCLTPGLDWTRLFMSLTAGAGTRCMSLLPDSPTLD